MTPRDRPTQSTRVAVVLLAFASFWSSSTAAAVEPELNAAMPQLLDPGAEPRVLLRFHLQEGMSQDFSTTTLRSDRTTVDGEVEPWVHAPSSTTLGTRTVTAVEADGRYRIENLTSSSDAQALVSGAPGVTTRTWQMDDRGQVWEAGAAGAPDGPASLVLPEEPVGIGAVWQMTSISDWPPVGEPVFEAETRTTNTLVDIHSDGGYEIRGEFVMAASDQDVPDAALPAGVEARYDEVILQGEYHWRLEARDPVISSRGTIDESTTVTVTVDGRSQTLTKESKVEVGLRVAESDDSAADR